MDYVENTRDYLQITTRAVENSNGPAEPSIILKRPQNSLPDRYIKPSTGKWETLDTKC